MEKLGVTLWQYQWHFFSIICFVLIILFLVTLFPIHSLYTSSLVREDAKKILIESSEKYGLPRSDFSFAIVKKDYIKLCRRPHQKGKDNLYCDDFYIRDF
ncbi:MAG: hypothetical protein KAS32_23035 [Candidatus Peribacteraceae bacterium]|nr:hypothetical protein [Candidatus Peribacteraceae bacterium]